MKIHTWKIEKLEQDYNCAYCVLFGTVPIVFLLVVIGL